MGLMGTMGDYIERVLNAIKEGEEAEGGRIRVRYIASVSRQGTSEQAREIVELALKYRE